MSRLAEIYKQEKKSGGGLTSTITKRLGEKIDPRQMLDSSGIIATMFPGLKPYSATPRKTPSIASSMPSISSGAGELSLIAQATKITAKNTLAMPAMARDMFLMKQNIIKLVKATGKKPQTKSGDFLSRQFAREAAFEQQMASMGRKAGSVGPSGGIEQEDGGSFLDKIGAIFGFPMFGKKAPVPPTPQPKGQYRDPKTGRFAKRPPPATAASRLGGLSTTLARALPFLSSALLPVLGIAGLAGLLVYLIKNDKGKGLSSDDIDKDNLDFTPDQQITASSFNTPGTDDEIRKARENMRASDNPDVRAAAAKLDVTNPLPTISPSPQPVITQPQPNVSPVPSNVVTSDSGSPIMTGAGVPLTSGESMSPTKQTSTSASTGSNGEFKSKEDFLKVMYPLAVEASKQLGGIDPNALLTQWGFESAWGTKTSGKYNYFGIKADKSWTGDKKDVMTHEYLQGEKVTLPQPFRSYNSPEEAVNDYVKFLKGNKRYEKAGVFQAKTSGEFFGALQKAGYATDPNYASKLTSATEGTARRTAQIQPTPPATGTMVASASSAMAGARQTTGGGSVAIDNSQRTTVASAPASGRPASAYDKDIVDALMGSTYA
jgi:flagellum-specific peptidoglycan hydrolase FlgJ